MKRDVSSWHLMYASFLLFLYVGSETIPLSAAEEQEHGLHEIGNIQSQEEARALIGGSSLSNDELQKLFWHAAHKGYLEAVQDMVQGKKVSICAADHEGRTALHKAVEGGHVPVIRHLMLNGARFDSANNDGFTPLLEAALYGQHEAFLELERLGADLTAKLPNGAGVLHAAVLGNSWPIVSYLVRKKDHIASPYSRDNAGETPVHYAARLGYAVPLMCFHQKDKAILSAQDANDMTPLFAALEAKNSSVARYLINVAWDGILRMSDLWGRTPLHVAAENGLSDVVSHLVEVREVPVDYKNFYWETPLYFAARAGRLDIVKYLIAKGADPEHVDNEESSPLLVAADAGAVKVVQHLVETARVDMTAESISGGTVLHCAAESGSLILVKYLIERCRISVNTVNVRSETPLGWAVLNNRLDIANYLIACGARIEEQPGHHMQNVGCSSRPLHLAVLAEEINGVMYLIKRGAKLYAIDFVKAAKKNCLTALIRELVGPVMKGEVNPHPFLDFIRSQARHSSSNMRLKTGEECWCALLYMLLVPQLDSAFHMPGAQHDRLMRVGTSMRQLLRDVQKQMQKRVPRDVAGIILCDFLCFPSEVFKQVAHDDSGVQSGVLASDRRKRPREDHEDCEGDDETLKQQSPKKTKCIKKN